MTPTSVPLNVLPLVVTTATVLSANAATSLKYFLCATDNFYFSIMDTKCAFVVFIFDLESDPVVTITCAFFFFGVGCVGRNFTVSWLTLHNMTDLKQPSKERPKKLRRNVDG